MFVIKTFYLLKITTYICVIFKILIFNLKHKMFKVLKGFKKSYKKITFKRNTFWKVLIKISNHLILMLM